MLLWSARGNHEIIEREIHGAHNRDIAQHNTGDGEGDERDIAESKLWFHGTGPTGISDYSRSWPRSVLNR